MDGDLEQEQRAIPDPGAVRMTVHLGYTDTDIYGRGWDPIFGKGSQAIVVKEAKLKLKAIRDAKSRVRIGDHIDYDLYGRGDPRIFGHGADIANRNEAAEALYKSQQYKIMHFRTTVFPSAAKALLRLTSIPKHADTRPEGDIIDPCQDERPDHVPSSELVTLLPSEIAELSIEGVANTEHDDEHTPEPIKVIEEQIFEVDLAVLVPQKGQCSDTDSETPVSEGPLSSADIWPEESVSDANFSAENRNPESSQEYLPSKGQSIAARMRAFEQSAPSQSLNERTQAAQKRDETRSEGISGRSRFFESQTQSQRLERPLGVSQEPVLIRPIGLRSRPSTEERDKTTLPPDTTLVGQDRSEEFAARIFIDRDVPNKERKDVPTILSPLTPETDDAHHPARLDSRDVSPAAKESAPAGITLNALTTWEVLSKMPDEVNIRASVHDGAAEKSQALNRGLKATSNFTPSSSSNEASNVQIFTASLRGQTVDASVMRAGGKEPPPGFQSLDEQNASNELDSKGRGIPHERFPEERGIDKGCRPTDSSSNGHVFLSGAIQANLTNDLSPSNEVVETPLGYSNTEGRPEDKSEQALTRENSLHASGSQEGNGSTQAQYDIPQTHSAPLRKIHISKMESLSPDHEVVTTQTTENRGGVAPDESIRPSDSIELASTALRCKSSDTVNYDTREIQARESTNEASSSSSSSSIQSDSSAAVDVEGSASGEASSSSDFVEGSSETEFTGLNGTPNLNIRSS
jgi:hypothetical protein